ncbi:MAG: mycoredoxin [Chloroflexota bacterium]|jgi:glutaredoxin|nr:mycoredoxin [Chloroflexota bacterium]
MEKIRIYYAPWCGECRLARRIFEEHNLEYELIDIDNNPEAQRVVQEINNGYKSVPTILFPSGGVVVEPNAPELISALRREGLIAAQA